MTAASAARRSRSALSRSRVGFWPTRTSLRRTLSRAEVAAVARSRAAASIRCAASSSDQAAITPSRRPSRAASLPAWAAHAAACAWATRALMAPPAKRVQRPWTPTE